MTHISLYQTKIVDALKNGAKLQCSEGVNYRTWLVYPNGEVETVRRDSANKVCLDFQDKLIFGEWSGVRWRF
jgi:hypothetical protein